jgi:hypothetical protein
MPLMKDAALNESVPPRVIHVSMNQGVSVQTDVAVVPVKPLKRTYTILGKLHCQIRQSVLQVSNWH